MATRPTPTLSGQPESVRRFIGQARGYVRLFRDVGDRNRAAALFGLLSRVETALLDGTAIPEHERVALIRAVEDASRYFETAEGKQLLQRIAQRGPV